MMTRTLIALLFGVLLSAAMPAFAQVNPTYSAALTISSDPSYPTPNSFVELTAESPLLDLQDSTIQWTVNGSPAGTGESVRVAVGALGRPTNVQVSVTGATGSDSATLTIIPASIDLLWESDSYVPPFYKGRAQPGSGSSVRVLAIPHFVNGSGALVPSSSLQFTWKLNGAVDRAQSGLGESSAVFPAASLYGNDTIDVTVKTSDGSIAAESSVAVQTQDPQLALYEDNPLFGVMYHAALSSIGSASESETSFVAVPYFADAVSANDHSLAYQWTVNGSSVAADPLDPSEITIKAQSAGTANVSLSLAKPTDPFFAASGQWQINFSNAAGGTGNVFRTTQ